jgi:hypothetical protein
VLPHEIELALHVFVLARHHDHRVLLRQNDGELSEGTITTIRGALAAPELVAVALQPVVLRFRTVRLVTARLLDVKLRRLVDPLCRQQLLVVPFSFLQQELAKLGKPFRLDAQAPAAGVDAARAVSQRMLKMPSGSNKRGLR